MSLRKFWIFVLCLGLLFTLGAAAQTSRDPDRRDLRGISPKRHKYIFTVLGGAAAGAGLGFVLPGEKTPLKLMLMGGGGASTWYLHTHRNALGNWHSMGLIGGNTALGWGIGWLGCNCRDGAYAGTLLGGGLTGAWVALESDRPARRGFRKVRGSLQRDNDQQQNNSSSSDGWINPED
jgi:hypothetical protein